MKDFNGQTLSCRSQGGILELTLHRPACNEIGSATLAEMERFVDAMDDAAGEASALIICSSLKTGFSAGADLRELYTRSREMPVEARTASVRDFLQRIHRVFNRIDSSPMTTVAAVHGVTFGGGFELALTCDLIIADRMARFCFPELRLGLIPGFGGIPRLRRDLGNGIVRDLLLTGRSINAVRAHAVGLVSQLAGEGEALNVARSTAAQIGKFDRATRATAKRFIKPLPVEQLTEEIEIFCRLFTEPAVESGLRRFVESTDAHPYLP
ncbi:MAG: enoyl-CoA hydratase/isomerase family protein [Acidobacteria bacterium]|nr:enoyl-CoA hydratase/isomerase family protein [Acidobacteriota bacterium]